MCLDGGEITLNHAAKLFDDVALFACLEERVGRSLPGKKLSRRKENEDLIGTLERAVLQHGLEAFGPEDDPGLQRAYKTGLLHAVGIDDEDGNMHYSFPSMVHHRSVWTPLWHGLGRFEG